MKRSILPKGNASLTISSSWRTKQAKKSKMRTRENSSRTSSYMTNTKIIRVQLAKASTTSFSSIALLIATCQRLTTRIMLVVTKVSQKKLYRLVIYSNLSFHTCLTSKNALQHVPTMYRKRQTQKTVYQNTVVSFNSIEGMITEIMAKGMTLKTIKGRKFWSIKNHRHFSQRQLQMCQTIGVLKRGKQSGFQTSTFKNSRFIFSLPFSQV